MGVKYKVLFINILAVHENMYANTFFFLIKSEACKRARGHDLLLVEEKSRLDLESIVLVNIFKNIINGLSIS